MEERNFINQALVLTCLSLLLEVFGHVYLSVIGCFGLMTYMLQPKFITMIILMSQWSDAGGLFIGSSFGTTKFAKTISPSKTWAGVAGAFLFPVSIVALPMWVIGILSEGSYALHLPLYDYLVLGLTSGFLSVTGDLLISFLKRCADVKDCGTLLGVHGGMLDRIDSALLNYPFIYWYALEYYQYTHSKNYDFNNVHIMNFLHWK